MGSKASSCRNIKSLTTPYRSLTFVTRWNFTTEWYQNVHTWSNRNWNSYIDIYMFQKFRHSINNSKNLLKHLVFTIMLYLFKFSKKSFRILYAHPVQFLCNSPLWMSHLGIISHAYFFSREQYLHPITWYCYTHTMYSPAILWYHWRRNERIRGGQ